MRRATILASTAGALMAACGHGGARMAEPHPGVVPEPHPTPETAPPTPEPETTTTEATTTTAPPARPPITVAAVAPPVTVAPEPTFEEEAAEWWEREALLNCIRSYEQGAAGYATETGNGYHGGFQFDQPTWDGVVGRAGHPEWIGRRAGDAPSYVQDDAAWLLFLERGLAPWPTPQAMC